MWVYWQDGSIFKCMCKQEGWVAIEREGAVMHTCVVLVVAINYPSPVHG